MVEEQSLVVDKHSNEYQALVEECQAIITEGVWSFRLERILTFGRLGERIITDSLYERYSKGNFKFLETIAEDIGISYSEVCRAVQFYEKFKIISPSSENWSKFKEGKNISWSKIKNSYLPTGEKKECKHSTEKTTVWKCRMCKKFFKDNPNEKQRA